MTIRGRVWLGADTGWVTSGWVDTPVYTIRDGQALIRYMNKPTFVPLPAALQLDDLNVKMEIQEKEVDF